MEDFLYYNELYDFYSGLLTEKQRQYFEDYYFNNLSLSEMAENYDVSRNAIFKQIKITKEKLDEFEEQLALKKKKDKIDSICKNIMDDKIRKELEDLF
ncbi:MAG: hypothetical protein IJ193_02530 [Bacilli bacterium]|nr:hypothetical protein [Bacilli bacterium]